MGCVQHSPLLPLTSLILVRLMENELSVQRVFLKTVCDSPEKATGKNEEVPWWTELLHVDICSSLICHHPALMRLLGRQK